MVQVLEILPGGKQGPILFLIAGFILCPRPANERRRYIVTSSLIGWVYSQNDPCIVNTTAATLSTGSHT